MMQYATMEERQAARAYATFKAGIYSKSDKVLFIESSEKITEEIAKLSGKPALCIESHNIYDASGVPRIKQRVKAMVKDGDSFIKKVFNKIKKFVNLPMLLTD